MPSVDDLAGLYPIKRTGNADNERRQINQLIRALVALIPEEHQGTFWSDLLGEPSSNPDFVNYIQSAIENQSPKSIEVTANTSLDLNDIPNDAVFYNTGLSDYTVTLPSTGLANHVGKRFHFNASSTWGSGLDVTCGLTGLMRDSSNTGAPYSVDDGRLTVTIVDGVIGQFYSVSGDYS